MPPKSGKQGAAKQGAAKQGAAKQGAAKRPTASKRRKDEPFRVALTFDAEHPDRRSTYGAQERVLDVLDKLDAKATFFVEACFFATTSRPR